MNEVSIRLITKAEQLPEIISNNFFHSTEFFLMAVKTPCYEPCMAVAEDADGNVVAHMLSIICRHRTLLPPWFYSHARIHGEGEYVENVDKDYLFGKMICALTHYFKHKFCLFVECSEISTKMFGYKHFKQNGYFSIPWQEIHNSLHSKNPEQRLSEKAKKRLRLAQMRGVETKILTDKHDLHTFYKQLRRYFLTKGRRYVPHEKIFQMMHEEGRSKTFATTYKNKIIGGCVCIYSQSEAFLWFLASKRTSYHHLSPDTTTVWAAIKYAHINNYQHIYFLDAGLPFKSNPFREFILKFGGKPVTKYRWFRFPCSAINKLFSWIYND